MVAHAYHQLYDHSLKADAVQEVFRIALEHLDTLRRHPKPDAWLMTTLNHVCLKMNAKEWVQSKIRTSPPTEPDPGLSELISPETRDDDAELLTLFYADGYTLSEIATRLGTTPAIVKKRLYRARQRFKEFLAKGEDEHG